MKSNADNWTDDMFIDAIKEGGKRRNMAWKQAYFQFRPMLLGRLINEGGSVEELNELLGEVFMDINQRVSQPDFSLDYGNFANYLWTSVRNKWIYIRKKEKSIKDRIQKYNDTNPHNPERILITKESLEKAAAMGEPCQTILIMAGNGFKNWEIAKKLGFAEQTIKNKLGKCRKQLINLLAGRDLY